MKEFPKMLYKAPGPHEIHAGRFDYTIVPDQEGQDAAIADGWHLTTGEAKAAHDEAVKAVVAPVEPVSETAPPTRAELEQKAGELNIKFDRRTSDKNLADLISATLEQ